MSSGGRKDKPEPSPSPKASSSADSEQGLLTSEDLFGDLVDAPIPPSRPAPAPSAPRREPIRVQVGEPGAPKKPGPAVAKGEVLPEDVAVLLDAFSEPGEAATRAEAAASPEPESPESLFEALVAPDAEPALLEPALPEVEPPPSEDAPALEALAPVAPASPPALHHRPHSPLEDAAEEADLLLDQLVEPAPSPRAADAPTDADSLLSGILEPAKKPALTEPVPRGRPKAPTPDMTLPPTHVDALLDLAELRKSLPRRTAEPPRPVSRTSTKFQAATPKAAPPTEGLGLDLAALAEDAMGLARTRPGGAPSAEAPAPAAEPAAPPSPAAGSQDVYGPYQLLNKVAVGGMAEVFKAKRSGVEGFEKVLAVKRILPHLSDNKEFVDMFIDEAKMVAGLAHPNIVQIFDLGKIEKTYYIAMEHVHGRDLRSIQRRAKDRGLRIPLDLAVLVVSKVCSALEYAHRKKDDKGRPMKIVHRDISPQNILISFEGDVKLTDFGIAKAATKASTTDRGALRGKLLYMSPEQAWGKPIDRRSDIFSLGIVFYELITEQKPFLASSEMSVLEMVRECHVAPPTSLNPRIPESLERVVMKALERDSEQRYQDAAEMYKDLDRVLHQRRAPTAAELARFMEVLFDENERGDAVHHEHSSGEHRSGERHLEIDLEPAHTEGAAMADEASVPKDPMSVERLLKRFGIK